MKILLVGEYSRLHNSLKEGLVALGHQVQIISTGDYFKNFPSDIKLIRKYDSGFKKIKVGIFKIFGIDISSISIKKQFFKHQNKLKNFDVVQLINESPFGVSPSTELQIISFLKKHNKKLFLLSCGADYISVNYALGNNLSYSILDNYKNGKGSKEYFDFALKYTTKPFKKLHKYIYSSINGVIASDIDYHIPLNGNSKYLGLIPNPVNIDKLEYRKLETDKTINIFLGINRNNYYTKGIIYFEEALLIIKKKYGEKIHIEIVENLPYLEYINKYNEAHIILDQILAYDQGYNALEAMAKGKVVFTGAEKEFEEYYSLNKIVAVNAIPNSQDIVEKLEELILHPEKITEIGNNAKVFVTNHHHYKKIAENYLEIWKNN